MSMLSSEIIEPKLAAAERLLRTRKLPAALDAFDRAERAGADPDRCSGGRWMVHMLDGKFEAAWRESDAIRRRGAPDRHRLWQGEPLRGKRVILRCLHGLGDALQFLRYAPQLRALAASLVVEVPPRFVGLAGCLRGVAEVITWGEDAPPKSPPWDVQIEIMELPYLFRTQQGDLPLATQYLDLPRRLLREAASIVGGPEALRVGLAWSAGEWNPTRSIPLETLRPLLQTEGCEFWNLQGGEASRHWESLPSALRLREHPKCSEDLLTLAAVIAQLDLVITVDSLAAHLAGALGVPAWVMLQHEGDWRWMHARDDSPWYPSLRLFRQSPAGGWKPLTAAIQHALQTLAQSRRMAA